jgi:hypothetical protein
MIVLRAMPSKAKRGETFTPLPAITQADIAEIKLGGKVAPIVSVDPVLKGPHVLQIMVLLDSMQRRALEDAEEPRTPLYGGSVGFQPHN